MRRFLSLLLGSAAVVGFESSFGMRRPKVAVPLMAHPSLKNCPVSFLPGGITYVSHFRDLQPMANGKILMVAD